MQNELANFYRISEGMEETYMLLITVYGSVQPAYINNRGLKA